jgi:multiple sugar transport system permease protein
MENVVESKTLPKKSFLDRFYVSHSNMPNDKRAKKANNARKRHKARIAYAFIIPAGLLFIVYTAIPFILSFIFAFTDFNGATINNWVGFDNFVRAFTDDAFMGTIKHVLIFAAFYVPLSIICSLFVAFLVSQTKVWKTAFKIIFYIPSLTSGVAMAFVWKSLLSGLNEMGGVNFLDSSYSMLALVAISVWSAIGGNMLIYLAAMTGIPKDIYEASSLDGANKFQQFIHMTIPLLRPTTYFIFTTTLIGSFQLFDMVYLIFGQENHFVDTPVMDIYYYGKSYLYGIGSAMSVILFFIIMIVTVILQVFVKEDKGDGSRRFFKKKQSKTQTH